MLGVDNFHQTIISARDYEFKILRDVHGEARLYLLTFESEKRFLSRKVNLYGCL